MILNPHEYIYLLIQSIIGISKDMEQYVEGGSEKLCI